VNAPKNQVDWARLFRVACNLIAQVNSLTPIIDRWTFGGGTAMMLQIGHRESHDVDFFLQDAQLLSFLDPEKRDFDFEIAPTGWTGDGTGFLKFSFAGIGEIDFIVGGPKTSNPTMLRDIEGHPTLLETVAEVVTKKIVHRGASLRPRDIFDIAAASERHADAVVNGLRSYKSAVATALDTLARLNPDFVAMAIAQLQVRERFRLLANATALERAQWILNAV
jgi:hypothetical protein